MGTDHRSPDGAERGCKSLALPGSLFDCVAETSRVQTYEVFHWSGAQVFPSSVIRCCFGKRDQQFDDSGLSGSGRLVDLLPGPELIVRCQAISPFVAVGQSVVSPIGQYQFVLCHVDDLGPNGRHMPGRCPGLRAGGSESVAPDRDDVGRCGGTRTGSKFSHWTSSRGRRPICGTARWPKGGQYQLG